MVRSVINTLMDMEYTKPGSCEFLVTRMLHRLARYTFSCRNLLFLIYLYLFNFFFMKTLSSSKEPSLKDLQEVAVRGFSKGKKVTEPENANAEADSKKKQQNKEAESNANLSPLARFLLSRFVGKFLY